MLTVYCVSTVESTPFGYLDGIGIGFGLGNVLRLGILTGPAPMWFSL